MEGVKRLRLENLRDRMFVGALSFWSQHEDVADPRSLIPALKSISDQDTNIYLTEISGGSPLGHLHHVVRDSFDLRFEKSFALGDYPDQRYIQRFVIPSYATLEQEQQPNFKSASAFIQHGFAAYEGLVLPFVDAKRVLRFSLSLCRLELLVEHVETSQKLTKREQQCLSKLAQGKSAKMMAAELCVSPKTVENTVERLKTKLGARNAAEAAAKAVFLNVLGEVETGTCVPRLSSRERQCLGLLLAGKTWQEIADDLRISPKTVDKHIASLKRKFGVRSVTQLAAVGLASFIRR